MNQSENQEILARYIFTKSQIRISDRMVKYSAFIPPEDRRLSVFRISGLQDAEIWKIGEKLRSQTLLGRADVESALVKKIGLGIEADDIPARHANIIGWPDELSAIKLKAMELAKEAELHLK